ncbi:MAG: hypothetical protein ACI80V_000826 [Rhodothermales bacterium]|jgi:hypothetical protein
MTKRTPIPPLLAAFVGEPELARQRRDAAVDPGAMAELRASFEIKRALDEGSRLEKGQLDDLLLALLAASDTRAAWKKRLMARVRSDPAALARLGELRARGAAIEATSDAAEHFARLTGHPQSGVTRGRGLWLAAASVLALTVCHGIYSRISEDPVRHAVWSEYRESGAQRGPTQTMTDLQDAERQARESRTTILGLWPRYDGGALLEAEALLDGRSDPDAILARARVQILGGREAEARETLGQLPPDGLVAAEGARLLAMLVAPSG